MEDTLGKRIAFHRKRLSLTQEALAEHLGVTAQAVSKWENDQSCPDISMLPKLAERFDISIDTLLGGPRKEVPIPEAAIPEKSAENAEETPGRIRWKILASPGAAIGLWLFLTGLVALIDALRLPPYDLADIGLVDIAASCGIFAFGLCGLFRRFSVLRLGCAMAGLVFVFNLITAPGIGDMDWRVPLAGGLALFGLDILLDTLLNRKWTTPRNHRIPACLNNIFESDEEGFNCATSFGKDNHLITVPHLSYGRSEVSFGNLTLDLTGCRQFSEACKLELHSHFSEMTLILPRWCQAEVNIHTAFAVCDTFGAPDPEATARIYVNGSAAFGHIILRYV